MKITVHANELLTALKKVENGAAQNWKIPVLRHFVFEALPNSTLTVSVSNMEIFLKSTVSDADVEHLTERTKFAVEIPAFRKGIRTLGDELIEIVVHDYQLTVEHSSGRFFLPLYKSPDEFPVPSPVMEPHHTIALEVPAVRSCLDILSLAMAEDELRPAMNGILFEFDKCLNMVSSDGYILALVETQIKSEFQGEYIIPRFVIQRLQRILPKTGFLTMQLSEKVYDSCITIEDGSETLTVHFKRTDGRYPKWRSVVDRNYSFDVTVGRRQLLRSLERSCIFSNSSSNLGVFRLDKDIPSKLIVESDDVDFETKAIESVDAEYLTSDNFAIGLKIPTLIKCLKPMTSQQIIFHIKDAGRAVLMEPDVQPDKEKITLLIMPMLLNN